MVRVQGISRPWLRLSLGDWLVLVLKPGSCLLTPVYSPSSGFSGGREGQKCVADGLQVAEWTDEGTWKC